MGTPWLVGDPPNRSDRIRLFCFPYAGGGATAYTSWRPAVPELDVQPVKLPGREGRLHEPAHSRMESLVDAIVEALLPFLSTPFALFGHSLGALVAFETARSLERVGREPVRLFVSGHVGPGVDPEIDEQRRLPDHALVEAIGGLGATPAPVLEDPDMMELFLSILRTDFELLQAYRFEPAPRLACPVSTFYGEQDGAGRADALGWRAVTTGPWRCQGFDGGHFFAFSESREDVLAAIARDLGVRRA